MNGNGVHKSSYSLRQLFFFGLRQAWIFSFFFRFRRLRPEVLLLVLSKRRWCNSSDGNSPRGDGHRTLCTRIWADELDGDFRGDRFESVSGSEAGLQRTFSRHPRLTVHVSEHTTGVMADSRIRGIFVV